MLDGCSRRRRRNKGRRRSVKRADENVERHDVALISGTVRKLFFFQSGERKMYAWVKDVGQKCDAVWTLNVTS